MRKTYKVHLRGGTTIKLKADDFVVKWDNTGKYTEWSAENCNRWLTFLPGDLVAVERVK